MATDALDPGPDGDYPYLEMDKQPTGLQVIGPRWRRVVIDVEGTGPDGRRVSEIKPPPDPAA